MFHLFTITSLFRALANSNFIQLTGKPLSDMSGFKGSASRKVFLPPCKRPASTLDQEPASDSTVPISPNVHASTNDVQIPSKRRKIESKKRKRPHKKNESQKRKRPNEEVENKKQVESKEEYSKDVENKEQPTKKQPNKEQSNKDGNKKKTKDRLPYITTSRSRVFYYRQFHTDTGILRNSLISSAEFSPSSHGQSASTSEGKPSQSPSNVDELMKYIFPMQYPSQPPDSKLQHPWRLRKMRDLVENMLRLNNQCQYMILLRHYCPIEVRHMLTSRSNVNLPSALMGS